MYSEDISRITFRGTNPDECEDFISAVRSKALAEGKYRDNQWIAYFASSCFVGAALYWYESLDESIQEDWKQLRPALLDRFGRKNQDPTSPSSPSIIPSPARFSTIPEPPAAAPPISKSGSLIRKGRLRLISSYRDEFRGYLAAAANSYGIYNQIDETAAVSLLVEIQSSSAEDVQEIRIPGGDFLAVSWVGIANSSWLGGRDAAACCLWSKTTSSTKWQTAKQVWTVSEENEVLVKYPTPNGGQEWLKPCIAFHGGFLRWIGPSNQGYGFQAIKVVFEEVA